MVERKTVLIGAQRPLQVRYLATEVGQNEKGARDPLIILHGWGVSAEHWRDVMHILEKKNIVAFAPDLPGFGDTEAPQAAWGIAEYAQFVEAFATEVSCRRFILLGHSFGGRIALYLARYKPERISQLILVDAAGVTSRAKRRLGAYAFAAKIGKYFLMLPGLRILHHVARRMIYRFVGTRDYYTLKGVMKEIFKKIIADNLVLYLPYIHMQTLIIWGAHDRTTPVSDAKILQAGIGHATLTILEDLGHSPHVHNSTLVAEHIAAFLQEDNNLS
jgi:pimeloyl-ACP methyl ester carboxylesterase